MEIYQHVGESKISEQPKKRLNFKLADGCVTPKKLSKRVATEVIQPMIDASLVDIQNQIDSLEISGLALSEKFGNNPHIGISQRKLTEALSSIWTVLLDSVLQVDFNSSVTSFFIGETTEIELSLSLPVKVTRLAFYDSLGNELYSEENSSSLSGTYTINSTITGDQEFTAVIDMLGARKALPLSIEAIEPIRSFEVTPVTVPDAEDTVLHIVAETAAAMLLKVEKVTEADRRTIYGPMEGDRIDFNYTLREPDAGTVNFVLTVVDRDATLTAETSITVTDIPQTITSFSVEPTQLYAEEQGTLHFTGAASREGKLSLLDPSGAVLHRVENTANIDFTYNITPASAGTLSFTFKAEKGSKEDSMNALVTVAAREYQLMYYGSSDTELTTGEQVKQALASTSQLITNTVQDRPYFYIAVHSTYFLESCRTLGEIQEEWNDSTLECVNEALSIPIGERTQVYRLYKAYTEPEIIEWGVTYDLQIKINK